MYSNSTTKVEITLLVFLSLFVFTCMGCSYHHAIFVDLEQFSDTPFVLAKVEIEDESPSTYAPLAVFSGNDTLRHVFWGATFIESIHKQNLAAELMTAVPYKAIAESLQETHGITLDTGEFEVAKHRTPYWNASHRTDHYARLYIRFDGSEPVRYRFELRSDGDKVMLHRDQVIIAHVDDPVRKKVLQSLEEAGISLAVDVLSYSPEACIPLLADALKRDLSKSEVE